MNFNGTPEEQLRQLLAMDGLIVERIATSPRFLYYAERIAFGTNLRWHVSVDFEVSNPPSAAATRRSRRNGG